MKRRNRKLILTAAAVSLLLIGCSHADEAPPPATTPPPVLIAATEPVAPPTEPAAAEPTAPVAVVPDAGEYDIKIYALDPEATVVIPDESVPLASAETLPPAGGPVTKRQAEAIAIQAAGLTQEHVSFLFTKEDVEDGIPVFEITFRSGFNEYEFEIAAETGEILSFEMEDFRND